MSEEALQIAEKRSERKRRKGKIYPYDCKEIQPVHLLKEISPEYSLEGLMLKVKLQYFGHLICRTDAFENT